MCTHDLALPSSVADHTSFKPLSKLFSTGLISSCHLSSLPFPRCFAPTPPEVSDHKYVESILLHSLNPAARKSPWRYKNCCSVSKWRKIAGNCRFGSLQLSVSPAVAWSCSVLQRPGWGDGVEEKGQCAVKNKCHV